MRSQHDHPVQIKIKCEVSDSILVEAADWELQFDMTTPAYNQSKERHFPVEILGGGLHPDGVLWSRSTKPVVWIELTNP